MMIGTVRRGLAVTAWALVGLVFGVGCSRDARLSGQKIRKATVKTVTHYGITLDEKASPEQVAYVMLRAIRDDVSAGDRQQRDAALDKQFDLCAANAIEERNTTSTSRDEYIHGVVYHWAPTLSHYVADFENDWEKAKPRLVRRDPKAGSPSAGGLPETEVLMEVGDPTGDPNARAVVIIWLVKDSGYWRVTHPGFDHEHRSIPTGIVSE